ncbi:hypothetical protein BDN70DRAFT_881955 [Pholiota conissans]|uniref:MYND-type domain-containing protein n=1 Tax=Pholiota conissans TaxID=109636 RepID=A0A9P5YX36_9AGAR|nr:hypothetical protein BDN70DRAFT_881955 [Pholiota conissans]
MAKLNCAVCAHQAAHQCAACRQVAYCGQDHQRQAWKKHKKMCKILQTIQQGEPAPDQTTYCGLCGDADGPLRTTLCCGKTICADYGKYVPFSYSKDSCSRNHDRYTTCCYHFNEKHTGNWKTCKKCASAHEAEARVWYGTNAFNFMGEILPNPPSFVPHTCKRCSRTIKMNCEGIARLPNGAMLCEQCKY